MIKRQRVDKLLQTTVQVSQTTVQKKAVRERTHIAIARLSYCLMMWGLILISGVLASTVQAAPETASGATDDTVAESALLLNQVSNANSQLFPNAAPNSVNRTTQPNTNHQTASTTITQPDNSMVQATLPNLNSPVIDQAGILLPEQRQQISQQITSIYQQGRAQIGLLILPTTGQEPIFNYASRAFEQWKLGNEKTDNGLLIVVAVTDRKLQILTGYGLEGVLPDIILKRIIEEQITPQFRQNNYAGGLIAGIGQIDSILKLDPEIAKASADQLQQQQTMQLQQQTQLQSGVVALVVLCLMGMFAALFLGKALSASIAGVVGIGWGLTSGLGLIGSVLLGGVVFSLLISSIAQLILFGLLRGGGGGFGGGRGGGFGGGGYRGGGGSFGGGGASGSW